MNTTAYPNLIYIITKILYQFGRSYCLPSPLVTQYRKKKTNFHCFCLDICTKNNFLNLFFEWKWLLDSYKELSWAGDDVTAIRHVFPIFCYINRNVWKFPLLLSKCTRMRVLLYSDYGIICLWMWFRSLDCSHLASTWRNWYL